MRMRIIQPNHKPFHTPTLSCITHTKKSFVLPRATAERRSTILAFPVIAWRQCEGPTDESPRKVQHDRLHFANEWPHRDRHTKRSKKSPRVQRYAWIKCHAR